MTAAVAIPGLSLADYSRDPEARGWGPPCSATLVRVQLTEAAVSVDARAAELTGLIMRANEKDGYRYRQADTGAYNCRHIGSNPRLPWSIHAWALAVDANWQTNPMTRPLHTDRPRWELDRWNRFGFAWGGDYKPPTDPDAMHTEFMGTPAQAAQLTTIARRELQPVIDGHPTPTADPEDPDMLLIRDEQGTLALLTDFAVWVPDNTSVAGLRTALKTVPVSNKFFKQVVELANRDETELGRIRVAVEKLAAASSA